MFETFCEFINFNPPTAGGKADPIGRDKRAKSDHQWPARLKRALYDRRIGASCFFSIVSPGGAGGPQNQINLTC